MSWVLVPSIGQAPKTLDTTFPTSQLKSTLP